MKTIKELINYTVATLISVITSLFWIPILSRMLSIESFAQYTFLNQAFLFFSTFLMVGTYYIQTTKKFDKTLVKHINHLNLFIIFLIVILMWMIDYGYTEIIVIGCLLYLYASFQNYMVFLNINAFSKFYSISQNSYSILKVLISIAIVYYIPNYLSVFIGLILSLIIINLILRSNKKIKQHIVITSKRESFKGRFIYIEILKVGIPLVLFSSLLNLFLLVDFYVLKIPKHLNTLAEFSSYSTLIISFFSIPTSILMLYVIPKYLKNRNNDNKNKNLILGISVNLVILIIFNIFIWLTGNLVFNFLLPANYYLEREIIHLLLFLAFLFNVLKQFAVHLQFIYFNYYARFIFFFFIMILLKYVIYRFLDITLFKILVIDILILILTILIIGLLIICNPLKIKGS